MHPVIILILLIGALIFFSWAKRANPAARNRALMYVGVGLIILMVLTGRLPWLFAVVGALIPLVQRVLTATQLFSTLRSASNRYKASQGPTPGQQSDVETPFLKMHLDHASGAMSGDVLSGRYAGKTLQALELGQLLELYNECRQGRDQQSCAVLDAYLQRRFGDDWREETQHAGAPGQGVNMSRDEACQILGVDSDATSDQIVEAHRRLMQKLHPDRGGSTYLAAKLNQAKDLLLGS